MSTIKSNGLLGLPHYNNSRVSMSNAEPIYLNNFIIQITLPAGLNKYVDNQKKNMWLEEVQKVGGLQTNKMPASIQEQHYKFATRSFPSGKPDKTTLDLSIDFETNLIYDSSSGRPSSFVVRTIRKWTDLIYDPLTGRQGLKRNFIAPQMTITMLDHGETPFWQWLCYDCFPTSPIPEVGLDYQADGIYKITGWKLRCDHWDETQL